MFKEDEKMSELKLTNDKIKAYDAEKKAFSTGKNLEVFGNAQNGVNELLAANINDLIKRVCALEDERVRHAEAMKKLAEELSAFKAELDRLRLTAKLNAGAIERLTNAQRIADPESSSQNA